MSHFHRYYIPGGSYFFTVVTEQRVPILANDFARDLLRAAFQDCFQRWPTFHVDAMVMLPDHLHAIWTLPPGDDQYSKRWGAIKKYFTQSWITHGGSEKSRSNSRIRYQRRGIWQRRFMEHTLRNDQDYARHFDYIHYNPVKHGVVQCPYDWPYSTFHLWVKSGTYNLNWGCVKDGLLDFADLAKTANE